MEPVTIALSLLLKNPSLAASAVGQATAPAPVDRARMQESFADLSKSILLCYHKSARFRSTDLLGSPWNRQAQYGAVNSMVVRIHYTGVSMTQYQMVVAVMAKPGKVRTAVLQDSAVVPYSKKCELEDWTGS